MTSVDERTLTLDDFLQLQALLHYEEETRSKHIEQHQEQHVHVEPSTLQYKLEQARLSEALLKLKWLKDQYRRERAMEIQIYLEHYRRQALIQAVLQEEEEQYYRQCIAAALEQRRIQACLQRYLDIKRKEELHAQLEKQQFFQDNSHVGYQEYHSQQLELLLKHIFNAENNNQNIACKKMEQSEEEQALTMAEVWKCLSDQKLSEETPRSAFLPEDHDVLLSNNNNSNQKQQTERESNVKLSSRAEKQDEVKPASRTEKKPDFPPVQDHVVSLQDLIQQLASKPVLVDNLQYSDEPKPSGIWAKQSQPPTQAKSPPPTAVEEVNGVEKPTSYLPEHIFTEAEPTPILENLPNTPLQEKKPTSFLPQHIFTEAEPTPKLEHMPEIPLTAPQDDSCSTEEECSEDQEATQHFVDSVAAEIKNETIPPDPRKLKAFEELDSISNQISSEDSDIVKRWKKVLESGKDLSFSKQKEGTLLLTATTEFNREFLGSEDELVRVMLRLDAIDSLGDESIREQRKGLVKKCESMLEDLDHFKQSQWEKTMKQ